MYASNMNRNLTPRTQQQPNPDLIREVVTLPSERAAMDLDPAGLHYSERPSDLSAFFGR